MDKFWDAVQTVAEIGVLLVFVGAILLVGVKMGGVH